MTLTYQNFCSWRTRDSSNPPPFLRLRSSYTFILITICIAIFTDIFLYAVIVPVIPFALRTRVGVAEEDVQHWVSVLLAVYGAALLAGSPICGFIADRTPNRRLPLLIGLLALAGATLLLCLGTTISLLLVGRILQGISAAIVWTVGLALLADTVGHEAIGQAVGYVSISMSVAILVAPLLGGVVYNKAGYFSVYYMAFGMIILDIFLRFALVEKKVAIQWNVIEPSGEEKIEGEDSFSNKTPAPSEARTLGATESSSIVNISAEKIQEYEARLSWLEEERKERLLMLRQKYDAATASKVIAIEPEEQGSSIDSPTIRAPLTPYPTAPGSTVNSDWSTYISQDHEFQVILLEIQNKKALLTSARLKLEAQPTATHTSVPPPSSRYRPGRAILLLLSSRRLLAALACILMQATLLTAWDAVLPLYVNRVFGWSSIGGGLIFLPLILPSFLAPLVGYWSDRKGPRWPTVLGFFLAIPFLVLLRLVNHAGIRQIVLLCALLALVGFAVVNGMTPLLAEVTYVVSHKEKTHAGVFGGSGAYATAYGFFNTAYAGGLLIGPIWGGFVMLKAGWGTMTWSLAVLSAGGGGIAWCFIGGGLWDGRRGEGGEAEGGQRVEE